MDLVKVLGKASDIAGVLDERAQRLIDVAIALVELEPQLRGAIGDASDPWAVYTAVRSGIAETAIADAFKAIGADEIYNKIKTLSDEFDGKLPAELEILLHDLGHYSEGASGTDDKRKKWSVGDDAGLIGWDADGKIASGKLPTGNLAASAGLSGAAAVACEAGSLWFYGKDAVPSKGLIRLGLAGELGATLDGKLPFASIASLSVDAKAGVSAQAHMFWRRPENQLVALAIQDVLAQPVDIFSLEAMLRASRERDFVGLIMAIDGHASVDIDLGVAREFDVDGFFSAKAGLTVSVELARKAAYELSLLKVDGGLRIALSHGDEDARKWGVAVGLEIDASPIARRVGAVMAEAVEHWDKVLEEVKPFLSPGTWLQTQAGIRLDKLLGKIGAEIGDEALDAALRSDLQLLLGHDGGGEAGLAQALADKVIDAVSSVENAVTGKADKLADQAIAKLARYLPAVAQDKLKARIKAEIAGLVEEYQGELNKLTDRLAKDEIDKVQAALRKLGTKVSDKVNKADERAAALRALVEKADALIHKIAAKAQDAAMAKISARLRFERGRLEQDQYELWGTFTDASPAAQDLYRALMLGRLQGLARVFDPAAPAIAGFTADPAKSSVRRFSKVTKSLGYEIVLLGMNLTGRAETSGSADIEVEVDDISVKTVAIAKRNAKGFGTSRKTDFVQTSTILLAKADSGRLDMLKSSFLLDLSSDRSDKNLTASEVRAFLKRMHETRLIGEARSEAAAKALEEMTGTRGGGKLPGAISVQMSLSALEMGRLVQRGALLGPEPGRAMDQNAREVFDLALDTLFLTGEWKGDNFDWFVRNSVPSDAAFDSASADPARAKYFANRAGVRQTLRGGGRPGSKIDPDAAPHRLGYNRHEAVMALPEMLALMAQIAAAVPARSGIGDGSGWGRGEYSKAGYKVADAADEWTGTNQWGLFFFGKGMDQRTVSFMLALAHLARGPLAGVETYDPLFDIALVMEEGDPLAF